MILRRKKKKPTFFQLTGVPLRVFHHNALILTDWCSTKGGVPSGGEKGIRRRLVEFLVFNSIHWKKSDPSNGENRVSKVDFFYKVFTCTH